MSKPPELAIAGSLMIGGEWPHVPIRFLLQAELRKALGITEEDDAELSDRAEAAEAKEKGEPYQEFDGPFEPSETVDPFAVIYVKAAAVALCWPNTLACPTLHDCRHNIVKYGAGAYDTLVSMHPGKGQRVQADIRKEGNRLIGEMITMATNALIKDVEAEKDFSQGREDTSISA